MRRLVFLIPDRTSEPRGGIINIVRHCQLARSLGADAVLATESGRDQHGRRWFRHDLRCIRWDDRAPEDWCLVPDLYSERSNAVEGPCVVYMQTPKWLLRNFNYLSEKVEIWTDSPLMVGLCRDRYPGKPIRIVPNIVDNTAFPFLEQSQRSPGMILVFPRKGADFIEAAFAAYRSDGGSYWKPHAVDGIPFERLTRVFREAQAFLASADVEGCALPPQESMAAGVVVVGKDAGGANFCMRDRETALVARSPEAAAAAMRELEDPELRTRLAHNAHREIRRFFPGAEPGQVWRGILQRAQEPCQP